MPMRDCGLDKLKEECGELITASAKATAFGLGRINDVHWDGTVPRQRIEQEMGDVLAALEFATWKLNLDSAAVKHRAAQKLATFHQWDKELDDNIEQG